MKTFTFLLFITFFCQFAVAENFPPSIVLRIKSELTGEKIGGAEIQVFENNSLINTQIADTSGIAEIRKIEQYKTYVLLVNKDGYASKRLELSTVNCDSEFGCVAAINIKLFKPYPHENFDFLKETAIAKLKFDSKGELIYNTDYSKFIQQKIDLCKNGASISQVNQHYTFIDSANHMIKEYKFDLALNYASKAFELINTDQTQQMIANCEKAIAERSETKKQFANFITEADVYFNERNYKKARSVYKKALKLVPSDYYSKHQIERCEALLEN